MPSLSETLSKGSVSGSYSRPRGWDSAQQACARVMNEAIAGLLLKAEELGGNGVREMESRGSSQWSARPVCLSESINLKGLQFDLAFDPNMIAIEGIQPGAFFGDAHIIGQEDIDLSNGTILFAVAKAATEDSGITEGEALHIEAKVMRAIDKLDDDILRIDRIQAIDSSDEFIDKIRVIGWE